MTFDREPVECVDCGLRWDDLDPEAEKCDCFAKNGTLLLKPIPESDLRWPVS